MPVGKILAMRKDNGIASADQRRNILQPALRIRLDMLQRRISDSDMSQV